MFFVMGIYDKIKEICATEEMQICESCGRYCTYKIFVSYMCLSLFFIPVLKWNRRYYAVSSCCGISKELDRETGRAFEKGELSKIK